MCLLPVRTPPPARPTHARRLRRHRPQTFFHAITFGRLFYLFYFWQNWWTSPTQNLIRFWSIYAVTLTINLQGKIWFLLYLSQNVRLPRNKKQIYRLNFRPQMGPSGLTLAMTLTFNFQGQICYLVYLGKIGRLPRNEVVYVWAFI